MWPETFNRIPSYDWAGSPVDSSALEYDAVMQHGWYRNLDPTLDELQRVSGDDSIVIDYSAGTGIFVQQYLARHPGARAGFVLVDASPKFLRLALEKFREDERIALRWIRFLKEQSRLEMLDEVLEQPMLSRGADALCSTNAIHLYYNLDGTLQAWYRALRPGATVLIQSGNIDNPAAPEDSCIIDCTVEHIQPIAKELVASDGRYQTLRPFAGSAERDAAADAIRQKFFLPVRPVKHYVEAMERAGFEVCEVYARPIPAQVSEWSEFLTAYHDGVLPWAGETRRIDGRDADGDTVALRKTLIRESLSRLFDDEPAFTACWTYMRCRKPS